jgi:tripartite-type tricarboxylate transporter receptor subunit TctC
VQASVSESRFITMSPRLLSAVIAVSLVAAAPVASEEAYPSRPLTIVVPFSAGGVTDTVARILAERMRVSLGQPVIVENITGAGGTLGVSRVVRAAADGYTASLGDLTSHVSSSAIFPVRYDVLNDLQPVALLTSAPQLLVGKRTMPATRLDELIAWLKSNPDTASAALPGAFGSGGHLSGLYFQKSTGTRFQFVPYRGGAPAVQDLIAGHVDLLFTDATNVLPYVRGGQIKAYGVTTKRRWAAAPDIPTIDEFGVPLYFSLWRGLWLPKGTPQDVIARLNAAVVDALVDPAVRQQLADQEIPPPGQQTPQALAAHHKAEIEKWWPIIKAANIKPE